MALKILPPDLAADAERKRRFLQEAKAASALNHPHIVTLYDVGNDGGFDYLVMEYVEGNTLAKLISRGITRHPEVDRVPVAGVAQRVTPRCGCVHRLSK